MTTIQKLKLLLSIRAWLKSRTLNIAAIIALLSGIDVSWFQGDIGSWILEHFLDLVNALPYLPDLTMGQGMSVIMFILGGIIAFLRAKTVHSLDQK